MALKKSILTNPDFKILYETDVLILGYVFEKALIYNKITGEKVFIGDFYGDPSCGLIGPNNDWYFVGGEHAVVGLKDKTPYTIPNKEICWIEKVRLVTLYEIEFLVDPWSNYGAVWYLDIATQKVRKVKDLKLTSPYQYDVDW